MTAPMRCNDAGRALIRRFEGCELTPYEDAAGFWSVGIGHKILPTEGDLLRGPITQEEAEILFAADVAVAERAVSAMTSVALNEWQFSALTSWTFNLGARAYRGSTLRRLLNAGDYVGASNEIGRWVFARRNGVAVKLPGLVARRDAEVAMFRKLPWLANA